MSLLLSICAQPTTGGMIPAAIPESANLDTAG